MKLKPFWLLVIGVAIMIGLSYLMFRLGERKERKNTANIQSELAWANERSRLIEESRDEMLGKVDSLVISIGELRTSISSFQSTFGEVFMESTLNSRKIREKLDKFMVEAMKRDEEAKRLQQLANSFED
jgi:hypothetical protein